MKKSFRHKIIIASLIVIAIVTYLAFMPINVNINRTVIAQRIHMLHPKVVDHLTVNVQGRYSIYLFRNNLFRGQINIEDYDFTKNTIVYLSISRFTNVLTFFNPTAGYTNILGEITIGFLFRSFDIIVYNRFVYHDYSSGYIDLYNDDNIFISTAYGYESLVLRYNRFINHLRALISENDYVGT